MEDFAALVERDWLAAFAQYSSYGEATPHIMQWVGISTVAGALGRKVYMDQKYFQWSPNFYIVLVGKQGFVRKSTSIDVGFNLLQQVPHIMIGPADATWPAFVQKMAESAPEGAARDFIMPDGTVYPMSSMNLGISELSTFFKVDDAPQVAGLTDLWDGKRGKFEKITKNNGCDTVVNPWINWIAATTPQWVSQNLTDDMLQGGLVSRFLFVYGEMPTKDVSYPKLGMPPEQDEHGQMLIDKLAKIAQYGGEVDLTPEAYAWGDAWYRAERDKLRAGTVETLEGGFLSRKQVHVHKLAMVLAAARNELPVIGLKTLQEALRLLEGLSGDASKVFGVVGQTMITAAAQKIVDAVQKYGQIDSNFLYRKLFFRTMQEDDYRAAVKCALAARYIWEVKTGGKTVLVANEEK